MVRPQEGIKFHLRYEIMYFLLFYFFVLTLGNFGGLRFRVFGVLGSWGLRFRGLRFLDTPPSWFVKVSAIWGGCLN